MKPEHAEEFRKGFEFRDASKDPRSSLDDMYESVGKIEYGVKPLMFGGGSGQTKFTVDMSKCKWK